MIRLCINTQTPPVRPLPSARQRGSRPWRLGKEYTAQVGGVVPMMRALLRAGTGRWIAPEPRWVALGTEEMPAELRTDEGYRLELVHLTAEQRRLYGRFKEAVWASFHGPGFPEFVPAEYRAFVEYSSQTALQLLTHLGEYDLFYINDFQQLLVGSLIGSAAPTLLRWHIPLEFRGYPEPVRRFFLRSMEGFDAIVLSTRAALEELIRAGFQGRAFQLYPYVDPAEHRPAPPGAAERFRERFGLGDGPLVVNVARLDPVKRQDLLIDAFAPIARRNPSARLVLVGGGSFSTRQLAGPSERSKAVEWEELLRRQIRARRLDHRVVITGSVPSELRDAAYDAASVFVHPTPWEGFGLVVIEAWLHHRPVVVSRGAGVAELVDDGLNGFSTPPASVPRISQAIDYLLRHPAEAEAMGHAGALSARRVFVQRAESRLRGIFEEAIHIYERDHLTPATSWRRSK
ncbi:MAG: glycosyltransferase family 4 protein [Thermoplasmata archaeon]